MNVQRNNICGSQKSRNNPSVCQQMSGWKNVVFAYNGLFGRTKEWSTHVCYVCMNLKNLLSEGSIYWGPAFIWFHLYEMSRIDKPLKAEYRWVGFQGLKAVVEVGVVAMGCRTFWEWKCPKIVAMIVKLRISESYLAKVFTGVNCVVGELSYIKAKKMLYVWM